MPEGLRWDNESKSLKIDQPWKGTLIQAVADWRAELEAADPDGPRGLDLTREDWLRGFQKLNEMLLSDPRRRGPATLPSLVINAFKRELVWKRDRARRNGAVNSWGGNGRSPSEKSEAAFQEAIRLIREHKRRTDEARQAGDDERATAQIPERISDFNPDA